MTADRSRYRLQIQGIVQGVGFRPFILRLAREYGLSGLVFNHSRGVTAEVEGPPAALREFLRQIPQQAPPLALIEEIRREEIPVLDDAGFFISQSSAGEPGASTLVSPDIATCPDCLRELFDPADRRHRYPFINCTNCGPRYTIIRHLPYDRPATAMSVFPMCPDCLSEYHDPANRRFHAQPNACWTCGPRCELHGPPGQLIPCSDPVAAAAAALREGEVVAVKGLGGFHLAASATRDDVLSGLRRRKRRDEKPFALMVRDFPAAEQLVLFDDTARLLLMSPQRPIVLLPRKPGAPVSPLVAPGNRYLGLMLPYTPLHHLLLEATGELALVMTSGNFSEEPIITGNRMALDCLSSIAGYFLLHNRDILIRNDDSIVRSHRGRAYFIRRARGYAPVPLRIKPEYPPVLAVGAELKNTVAVNAGGYAFLSQHIGDLENAEVFSSFESTIDHLKKLFSCRPGIIAHDLHPEYLSTKYAWSLTRHECIGIQHHHAHIVSCLAENDHPGPVIGLSLDGTGYGSDGKIWGGEILQANRRDFQRLYHFRYVPMPGGGLAIREPWRMALSYLLDAFDGELPEDPALLLPEPGPEQLALVRQMIQRRLNSPETSSCGRLFDAVAALAGLRQRVSFEGQAAMELEMVLEESSEKPYPFTWRNGEIDPAPMIRALYADRRQGRTAGSLSYRFHSGLVELFCALCREIRDRLELNVVALSGGVFQNLWLLSNLQSRLEALGFQVLTHRLVPCNDGGIALGQLVAAAERKVSE